MKKFPYGVHSKELREEAAKLVVAINEQFSTVVTELLILTDRA